MALLMAKVANLFILPFMVHCTLGEQCVDDDDACFAEPAARSAVQKRSRRGSQQRFMEENVEPVRKVSLAGIQAFIHKDSDVEQTGRGRWILTDQSGCSDADLAERTRNMPELVFRGHPSEHGMCMFMVEGSQDEVEGFLANQSWTSNMLVETDSEISIPELDSLLPSERRQIMQLAEMDESQSLPWGLDRIDDRQGLDNDYATPLGLSGVGVHVYVMDTGIKASHTEFAGRVIPTLDVTSGMPVQCGSQDTDCAADVQGHGTHCAGTVGGKSMGVAKDVRLHAVKVLGDNGSGYKSWVEMALDWICQNAEHPAVLSASLGAPVSPLLSDVVAAEALLAAGITYVVAAGNDQKPACEVSPAGLATAITVGASEWSGADKFASYSNYGSCVDILAPGTDVVSADAQSDEGFVSYSGTSMACPHVAGAAALLLNEEPGRTPEQIKELLALRATPASLTNVPEATPNRLLYTGTDTGAPTPVPTPVPPTPEPTPYPAVPATGTCGFNDYFEQQPWCNMWRNEGPVADPKLGYCWAPVGSQSDADTGPSDAPDGSSFFLVADATTGTKASAGDQALLSSMPLILHDEQELQFYYHMYGEDVLALVVLINDESIWVRVGNQGNIWHHATVDLRKYVAYASPVITFKAIANEATGLQKAKCNIAIDAVSFVHPTPAPAPTPIPTLPTLAPTLSPTPIPTPMPETLPETCNFEVSCNSWGNAGTELWEQDQGVMRMTCCQGGGGGQKKAILTPLQSPLKFAYPAQMKFKYFLKNPGVSGLEVRINGIPRWHEHKKEAMWKEAEVDISGPGGPLFGTTQAIELQIIGKMHGSGATGDILVDDIAFNFL